MLSIFSRNIDPLSGRNLYRMHTIPLIQSMFFCGLWNRLSTVIFTVPKNHQLSSRKRRFKKTVVNSKERPTVSV